MATEHNHAYPESVVLNVTANDIKRGMANDTMLCPIARAAKRKLKTEVRVNYATLMVDHGGDWMDRYFLSDEAAGWMEDFDSGKPVLPCKVKVTK